MDGESRLKSSSSDVRRLVEALEAHVMGRPGIERSWHTMGLSLKRDGRVVLRIDPKSDFVALRMATSAADRLPARLTAPYGGRKAAGWVRLHPRDRDGLEAVKSVIF